MSRGPQRLDRLDLADEILRMPRLADIVQLAGASLRTSLARKHTYDDA
jgi:hypothetical protein